jgi:RNA polymerase sigma-70 factor, ECF subfamily
MRHVDRYIDTLMDRVQKGDAIAFEQLYDHLLPRMKAFILSRGQVGALMVDDVIQEVFCRVWERRHGFVRQSSAQTYLFGIALNVIRESRRAAAYRARWLASSSAYVSAVSDCHEEAVRAEITRLLALARLTLSPKQSLAITLVYDRGMAPRRAAGDAGCTVKALRRRLEDGRRRLHAFFNAQIEP